jgi:hypothetical protein
MTTTKQYYILCTDCAGTGHVPEMGLSTSTTRICPVCCGGGTKLITEITTEL